MRYDEKEYILKNGLRCLLRSPEAGDARGILENMKQTSGETDFMARYEDEITMTNEEEQVYLDKIVNDPKSMMVSALINGEIIANAGFSLIAPYERYQHRAEFGISIQREYWGLGIGSLLLSAVIESAKAAGYEQIELEVVSDNARAVALYKKFGFRIYGTRERSFKFRDSTYAAEHLMILTL